MGDLSPPNAIWDTLPHAFPSLEQSERWLPLLKRHAQLLLESAARVSTTSVDDADVATRLFGESLETLRIILEHQRGRANDAQILHVVDVGSGGGFPGLVFASVMPSWQLTLVESLQKRASLLEEIAAELKLDNVAVVASRAEDAGRGPLRDTADLVTARAVAALPELVEYTAPFARTGGQIALPKGSRLTNELADARRAMQELQVSLTAQVRCRPEVSATPWTLLLTKEAATPARYPRRPGIPRKRPL